MRCLVVIFVLLIAGSCKKAFFEEDDELYHSRTPYEGDELRIDGYYYFSYGNPEIWVLEVFYRNGVYLHAGAQLLSDIEEVENSFKNGRFHQNIVDSKLSWGVFKVDGEKILFERWYPNSPGPRLAYVREGNILNDTTFRITESYRMVDGKKTEIKNRDELYHFKAFSPKPDSANSFIK